MNPIRIALALAVIAAPLAAQQPDTSKRPGMRMDMGGGMGMMGGGMGMGGMMGHMGQMMGPMMRVMVFSPGHLLAHREVLGLTDQQVSKLTALRDATQSAEQAARADADTHGRALAGVLSSANPDTAQLKAHFQEMHAAIGKAHWAALSAAARARVILTDVQRARADGWADAMGQMMQMGGHGMMGGHDMMRGRGMMGGHDSTHH